MEMVLSRRFTAALFAAAAFISLNASAQQAVAPQPASTAGSAAKSGSTVAQAPTPAVADTVVLMRGPAGEVTLAQVRAALQVIVPAHQREKFFDNPRNIEQLALSVYARKALTAQAQQQRFDQQPDVVQAVEIAKMQLIGDMWLEEKSKEAEPTPEQLEKYARSIFNAESSGKSKDGQTADFESQRSTLMEQARTKLVNQARAEIWTAAQAGATPVVDAIAAQVTAPAEKNK